MRNRLVLALPSLLAVAACGSSAGGVGSDAASDHRADDVDANTDAKPQADCGAILLLPPIVEVVDAVTGTPICDPVFKVDWPDGGATSGNGMAVACSQSKSDGCPGAPDGGGTAPCAFSLAIFDGNNVTVEVSHPGYENAIVQVSSGRGGCVPYVAASHAVVELHPKADASTNGG
jgi:hypothetical protein